MLQNFIPQTLNEWVYLILIVFLCIILFCFYKAIMKCKDIIQSYVDECHAFSTYYDTASDLISFAETFYPNILNEYCDESNKSSIEVDLALNSFNNIGGKND